MAKKNKAKKITTKKAVEVIDDEVKTVKVRNVMMKRNSYVNPQYRLERDEAALAKVTSQRQCKGKIAKVVITRNMEVNDNKELVTEMTVHLK